MIGEDMISLSPLFLCFRFCVWVWMIGEDVRICVLFGI